MFQLRPRGSCADTTRGGRRLVHIPPFIPRKLVGIRSSVIILFQRPQETLSRLALETEVSFGSRVTVRGPSLPFGFLSYRSQYILFGLSSVNWDSVPLMDT